MSRASRLYVGWASSNKLLRAYLDFPCWHETDMPTTLRDVRFQGQSGKHMLASSFSGFDPGRTCAQNFAFSARARFHTGWVQAVWKRFSYPNNCK